MPDLHSRAVTERAERRAAPRPGRSSEPAGPGDRDARARREPPSRERRTADPLPWAPRWTRRHLLLTRLPQPAQILAWIYAGRLLIALAVFASVVLIWQQVSPSLTLTASLVLVATLGFTASSFWFSHILNRTLGRNFFYSQSVYDVVLVTAVVHLTGGTGSNFAPLYILVICAAAVLLPFLGGFLIALLASALYAAEAAWTASGGLDGGMALQVGLFAIVALVTGYLGDQLRQTGTALGEVETELELLRLDTDEILGTINTGILTVDAHQRLAYMNRAAAELLSLDAAEWMGRPVIEELNRAAPGLGWVIARSQRERRPIARFETGDLLQGSFVLGVSTALVDRPGGGAPPITAIFQNITEKRQVEQLERRAERLEAIAQLSASLAHEIKNPLASIRSAAEQLAQPEVELDDRRVLNQLVVRESARLSRLLGEFIDFARVKLISPVSVDMAALVQDSVALVGAHPDAAGVTIDVDLGPDPQRLLVNGGEDLLHRALVNLVLNAAQWAGTPGEVRVSLERVRTDILSPAQGPQDAVRVRVADSGPGIEPEIADHIFNPFFTLRPGGTGLGLALVQRAAEAHGGIVYVEEPRAGGDGGAVMALCLPALTASAAAHAPATRLNGAEI